MKTETKQKLITLTVFILTPLTSFGYLYNNYTQSQNCRLNITQYSKYIPELKCPEYSQTWNLQGINSQIENNSNLIKSFESDNKTEFLKIQNDLIEISPNLNDSNYWMEKIKNQKFYIGILNVKNEMLTNSKPVIEENKSKIASILNNEKFLVDDNDKQIVNNFRTSDEYVILKETSNINKIKKSILSNLLGSRNNKQSMSDSDYISYKESLKDFTPEQFLLISDGLSTDNQNYWNKTIISPETDKVIYDQAFKRGYKWRKKATPQELTGISEFDLTKDTKNALNELITAASKDNFKIKLASGFRDPEYQKTIFTGRLQGECNQLFNKPCSSEDIQSLKATPAIEKVLQTTSVPGTSKHHTGRTVDINEIGTSDLLQFKDTASYNWISKDNYFNLKRFGFVPSYPPGGMNMGPNPEPWEIVFVGKELLTK